MRGAPAILLIVLVAAALSLMGLAVAACLDVTPVYVEQPEASTLADASCFTCIQLPADQRGCADVLDKCANNPDCKPVLDCVVAADCFDKQAVGDKINCAAPCVLDAGITTVDDPRVGALFDVVKCGQDNCGIACNFGDAGVALDGF